MDRGYTMAEMTDEFVSEWLLIVDPEFSDDGELLGGRVACHSKDRDEVYRASLSIKVPVAAYHYTGTMPANTAIVL